MRDGKRDKFDVAVRKKWKAERRKTRNQEPVIDERSMKKVLIISQMLDEAKNFA